MKRIVVISLMRSTRRA